MLWHVHVYTSVNVCLLFEDIEYSCNALLPPFHLMDVIDHLGHLNAFLVRCSTRATANSLWRKKGSITHTGDQMQSYNM